MRDLPFQRRDDVNFRKLNIFALSGHFGDLFQLPGGWNLSATAAH
jgi:hypothetical protein